MKSRRVVIKAGLGAVASGLCLPELFRGQAVRLVRTPFLQNVRPNRATILWGTDQVGSAMVQFSTDPSFSQNVMAQTKPFTPAETGLPAPYYQHRVDLSALAPGVQYFYRVLLDGQLLTSGDSFRTAGPGDFTFLVFGDSGQDSPAQLQLARLMLNEGAALVLHVGDLAYESGTYDQFQRTYFNEYRELMRRAPFFAAPGNHEYNSNLAAPYLALHAPPADDVPAVDRGRYYSFDWGNVHFVSLDTNVPLQRAVQGTGAMLDWLDNDLQRTRQTWKVVYFHHVPYPVLHHQEDPLSKLARDRVVPILEKHGVDLVFSGHEHNYQQTRPLRANQPVTSGPGTIYVTTGGGGAVLYPVIPNPIQVYADSKYHYMRVRVEGDRITVQAIGLDGKDIDRFELRTSSPITPQSQQPLVQASVNSASFLPSLAPGSLFSIFGQNLATREDAARALPLPLQMPGAIAAINGRPIPLLYTSPAQINAQLPYGVTGQAKLTIASALGSIDSDVKISDVAPAIFAIQDDGAVIHMNGALVSRSSPANPGEVLSVFLTGLGEVNGEITAGRPAPATALTVRATVTVELGGLRVTPLFAGLAPGFAGLYQVNFEVPPTLPTGRHSLKVLADGVPSNGVNVHAISLSPSAI